MTTCFRCLLTTIIFVMSLTVPSGGTAPAAVTDADWTAMNSGWVWHGTVYAIRHFHGKTYFAGTLYSDSAMGKQIAVLDGITWSAISLGKRGGDTIRTLAFDSSGTLYAGGRFDSLGGVKTKNIARWDGHAWHAMGSGLGSDLNAGFVQAMECTKSGTLYAGGWFPGAGGLAVKGIARWNGSYWDSIATPPNDPVTTLIIDKNDRVYAAGSFDSIGGNRICGIALWDGVSWQQVGTSPPIGVRAFAISASGELYAGGQFYSANGLSDIVRWNGIEWLALSKDLAWDYSKLLRIQTLTFDNSGALYVGGFIGKVSYTESDSSGVTRSVSKTLRFIGRYREGVWDTMGSGLDTVVNAIACTGGKVFAGGEGGQPAGTYDHVNLAVWDGASWTRYTDAMDSTTVYALTVDTNGTVYAGGDFLRIGDKLVNRIARTNGDAWDTVSLRFNSAIKAIALSADGSLSVGGHFSQPGNRFAAWNGVKWIRGSYDNVVECLLATAKVGLIIGGAFTNKTTLGNPIDCHYVYSLAIDGEGSLYAGTDRFVARWNDTTWKPLEGLTIGAYDRYGLVGNKNGGVFAGGNRRVYMYDNIGWSSIGTTDGNVIALARDSAGYLYAGGNFGKIDNMAAAGIAQYDGHAWHPLGSGISGEVRTIVVRDSTLYAGGNFRMAGDRIALGIARVNIHTPEFALKATGSTKPASDKLSIRFAGTKLFLTGGIPADRIDVFSIDGRLLCRIDDAATVVDIARYGAQTFIIRIQRQGMVLAAKMVRP